MDIKAAFKVISFILVTLFVSLSLVAAPSPKTVLITQIIEHPFSDAVRQGILAALRDNGFEDGKTINITYENAQGSTVTAMQIAKKFVSLKPDLMISITTPSTLALAKANEKSSIPIVFAAVTDPVGAGIVPSLSHPSGAITGATESPSPKKQLETFKEILPHLKTIGILYNPDEKNSESSVKETRQLAKIMGLTLVEATATKTEDILSALQQLVGKKVDAIFVPLDKTILSELGDILKISFESKIPVVTTDSDSVAQGALASSGYTHFATGYAAGEIATRILKGEKPGEIPVATAQDINVYINLQSARLLGIKIPPDILKSAKHM